LNTTYGIFSEKLRVVNIGLATFGEDLIAQGQETVVVDWQIPAKGDMRLVAELKQLENMEVEKANQETVERMLNSEPVLIGVGKAGKVIPGMTERSIFHAGPQITWERMCPAVQRSAIGAILFEGWAESPAEAERLAQSEINFSPNHFHSAVGPMTGIISPSMPVWIVENKKFGNRAYSTMNEGKGRVLWYGDFNEETLERLRWIKEVLGPSLYAALYKSQGINVYNLIAQGLQMGDEVHVRCGATTALMIREIAPLLLDAGVDSAAAASVLRFMAGNNTFSLNLAMAAAKSVMDAAHGVPNSTIVTALTRNGTDFGIRVGGLSDQWFISPAPVLDECLYYPGYSSDDAIADIGDSAIIETAGFGGMTIACAPTIASFVGGSLNHEIQVNKEMASISFGKSQKFAIPCMNFAGGPTGLDIRKIVLSQIVPIIDTGVVHKEPNIGQIGAGIARAPISCFEQAVLAFGDKNMAETY
jgi:hypothetical protein